MLTLKLHVASRAKPGESECGDHVGVVHEGTHWAIAVADGLGHGPAAAFAAKSAVDCVLADPWGEPTELFERADRHLVSTRGSALTLLRFDVAAETMTHVAVGNVEVSWMSGKAQRALCTPGYLGGRLRTCKANHYPLHAGDRIVAFTDGISGRFTRGAIERDVARAAAAILADHARLHDDATCVVIHVDGRSSRPIE
jgi:serine phosphatase RsbU (regulator of sigma subunit)